MPIASGGVGHRAFTASKSFALLSFARALEGARASGRAAGCSWGVPWGRGARVEVRRVRGVGAVLSIAGGGDGSSCLHRIIFLWTGVIGISTEFPPVLEAELFENYSNKT